MSTTDVDGATKKEALKDQKKGEMKEKTGNALHMRGLQEKGAQQAAQGHEVYPKEDGKAAGAGAKDKLVGTAKEVAGGLTGKHDLEQKGKAQAKGGEAQQEAHQ